MVLMAISPAKRKLLKDSIKRLFDLGLSESEIIENLKSVGVDEATALDIIGELKGISQKSREVKEKPLQEPSPVVTKSSDDVSDENFFEDVYVEPEVEQEKEPVKEPIKESEKVVAGKKSETPEKQDVSSKSIQHVVESSGIPKDDSLNELWEKGIIAAVDARLTEMQKLKEDIDSVIDSKISEKFKAESKKFETIFDSQVQLFNAKASAKLDSNIEEISKVLEAKAKESEDASALVKESLEKLKVEKKLNAEILNSINDKLAGLDTLRSQISSDLAVFFESNSKKFNEFLVESVRKRDEIEARITRSLQLESKITEGLIEDARHKIEGMRFEKEAEIEKRVADKIAELEEMTKKVDPKGVIAALDSIKQVEALVDSKLASLDKSFESRFNEVSKKLDAKFNILGKQFQTEKQEFSKFAEKKFSELQGAYVESLDEMFSKQLVAWDSKIKERFVKLSELEAKMDVEKFNATLESFDVFKKQFVNTISKSIEDYNRTKKEMTEFLMERDKAIDRHIKRLDQKLEELSVFQQKLLSILDELPEKKKSKGDKLGK